MTNIDEARKRLRQWARSVEGERDAWGRLAADMHTVLDALDAAERERDEESGRANDAIIREGRRTDERDAALAVIERIDSEVKDFAQTDNDALCAIEHILSNLTPADVLRERDAEKWDEGYTIGNRHNGRRDANPYRETKERG